MKKGDYKINFLVIFLGTFFALNFSLVSFSNSAEIQSEELVKIESRPKVTQSFILIKPDKAVASVVLFAGGRGNVGVKKYTSGKPFITKLNKNFLIRTRRDFAKNGLMVAVVDAPSNKREGMFFKWRIGQKHVDDISGVVSHLKKQADIPIWLVGTSAGTFSAANGAIRIKENINGIVLSSSVTIVRKHRTLVFYKAHPNGILNMNLDKITVPTLIVSHRDDKCDITPPEDAEKIKAALVNAPKVEVMYFTGGKLPKSGPCRALSAHGFYGIEEEVVASIADYIKANFK